MMKKYNTGGMKNPNAKAEVTPKAKYGKNMKAKGTMKKMGKMK